MPTDLYSILRIGGVRAARISWKFIYSISVCLQVKWNLLVSPAIIIVPSVARQIAIIIIVLFFTNMTLALK
jgi:hypothetical protein